MNGITRKICMIAILWLFLCGVLPCTQVQGYSGPVIEASSVTAQAGGEAELNIVLYNNPGIVSMILDVEYDTSVLKLVEVKDTGLLGSAMHSDKLSMCPYRLCWANDLATTNYTANGAIVTLVFSVNESAEVGEYPVSVRYTRDNFEIFNCDAKEVDFDLMAGSVQITRGQCGHEQKREIPEKAANCLNPGNNRYYICDACGAALKADGVTPTTKAAEEIPVIDHVFTFRIIRKPTFTECGTIMEECKGCGYEEYYAISELTPEFYDIVQWEGSPTCTEPGKVRYVWKRTWYGYQYVDVDAPATGHDFGLWVIDTEPAGGKGAGTMHRDCANGHTESSSYNFTLTDVPNGKYYSKPVYWAFVNGITKGKTATEFQRDADCTRKQIVMFLWRAAGQPEPESMVNPFTDVKADQFEKAILWAYYEGITSGKTATEFQPEAPCTREQIVMFLWRFNGKPEPQSMNNPFTDVKIGGTFEKAILWAYYEGVTTGKTATTFEPQATCTRGQIVTFLYRDLAE